MTKNLLNNAVQLRHLAMLLAMLCGVLTANAQLESDDINAAILVEGSVPVKWTNDAENPWYVPEGADYVRIPEGNDATFTTILEGTYSSSYPTEITFSWKHQSYTSSHYMTLQIDGEVKKSSNNSSWTSISAVIIPAGTHTIKFTSTIRRYNNNYWSGLKTLRIWECRELESACLKEGSLPLTFDNDSDLNNMWITEDGYIKSPYGESTSVSTTFTIDKPSIFAYEINKSADKTDYSVYVYVDGVLFDSSPNYSWFSGSLVLYPGTHTIEFCGKRTYDSSSYNNRMVIRNVRLDQNWYEVTLNAPGELGTRMTQVMEGQPIQNMELLKIRGAMNSDDWSTLKLATGIKAIDFTETGITSVPANGCSGFSNLSTVMLPETVTEIGDEAFKSSRFHQISIPAAVGTIGNNVWKQTRMRYINFAENSKLKKLGYGVFYGTRLIEFDMPDSVETLVREYDYSRYRSNLFNSCKSLKRIHLSEGLTYVPGDLAYECTNLEEVNIPTQTTWIGAYAFYNASLTSVTLPQPLTSIGDYAFYYNYFEDLSLPKNVSSLGKYAFSKCTKLKSVNLNSHCWAMNYNFSDCTALEKVVLPCATPPTREYDPFSGVTKANVTLVVPDFAFDSYRADSYWYNFTNTVKGDEASINDYWSLRGTLNLNNTLVMQGNPSVEIMEGGKLTLDNNSTQTFNEFTYNTGEASPAVVYSKSNSIKADRLVSKFYVSTADKWFFFSPVTDVNMSEVTYSSTDSWVIRYYDSARRASQNASSGNWTTVPSDGVLKSGQGYIVQARSTGWLTLPAANSSEHDKFFGSNQVNFELAENPCETKANAGWNFVANPYPTYYDIYYLDLQAPITVWTGSTYKAYSLNDGDRGDDTFVLRPMQPFFVQKDSTDINVGLPLVGRQINTTIDRSRAPRPVVVDENRHKLNLELYCDDNEEADDYTRVVINEAASLAYETVRDASKFMSMETEVAQLYTLGNDALPMAINERPYEDGNVALGVYLPATDRTYRIAAIRADRKAWLYDAETGMEFDLTEGDYIFTASKTGIDNKRFSIRFAPAANSVEGVEASVVKVTGNVGSISVTAPADATVAIYATDGSVTATAASEGTPLEFAVHAGVYVVNVNGESFKTIVK